MMDLLNPKSQVSGPDPGMLLQGGGGALKAEVLNGAAKAVRGSMRWGMNPLSLGGSGGPPPENFSKSMYLRTHFKPF